MKTHFFLLQLLCLSFYLSAHAQVMDLSGTWRFAVDRNNEGISAQWYLQTLNDQVQLPGSNPQVVEKEEYPSILRTLPLGKSYMDRW